MSLWEYLIESWEEYPALPDRLLLPRDPDSPETALAEFEEKLDESDLEPANKSGGTWVLIRGRFVSSEDPRPGDELDFGHLGFYGKSTPEGKWRSLDTRYEQWDAEGLEVIGWESWDSEGEDAGLVMEPCPVDFFVWVPDEIRVLRLHYRWEPHRGPMSKMIKVPYSPRSEGT